ncbi:MAG TPA: 3-phosphoshikimate 1-carboxyvinyltransferase [Clostridia bacterium]|nr:3-phosphoshikimate 1-carboxyvinyltransferase [Clostridia bacterium]
MKVQIHPMNKLKGIIHIPGDKSISHRGVIFGALAKGTTRLKNFLMADDCINTINVFRKMGISIDILDKNAIIIQGKGINGLSKPIGILDAGNSGTTARLLMGLLSGQVFPSIISGDDSLQTRPMDRITVPLDMMGANLSSQNKKGFLPIHIKGRTTRPLKAIDYSLPVASAQVKSSIILASLYAEDSCTIRQPATSRDHTEIMLKTFGGDIHTVDDTITTYPIQQLLAQDINVPGDISSAAYFITAALLAENSEISLPNIGINPTRSGILDVYRKMGAQIVLDRVNHIDGEPSANITAKSSSLKAVVIEGTIIPRLIDEIPIIALAATQAKGTTLIRDAQELKVKESNRIDSTVNILKGFGANIEATPDGMIIQGPTPLYGTRVHPGSDHRSIMMAAVAGLIAKGSTTIENSQWVDISYPDFFQQIKKL